MIFAEVSSGRSDLDSSSPTKPERPGSAAAATGSIGAAEAALAGRLERRGAHGDDPLVFGRAHGLDGVAGIDRPLERVGRHHFDDVGNLHDVEQRRDPRHDVLSGRGRRRHDGFVRRSERHDQRRGRLGQHVLVSGRVREQDLGHAVELRRGLGDRLAVMTGDQNVHLGAERLGRGQRLGGRVLERVIVVLGEQKRRHQTAPASLSFSTSSATLLTLTPALRTGGSAVLITSSRGLMSTP